MTIESKAFYFENPGAVNTDEVLRIAKKRAGELGIQTVLLASTTGETAIKAMEVFSGFRVITVTHYTNLKQPNAYNFTEENRKIIESKGGVILTSIHAFAEVGGRDPGPQPNMFLGIGHIVANTLLRIFGPGMKVACQIVLMAADAGLVHTDGDVIAIGGTGRGADTAVILKPVNSKDFFEFRIKEILCKPHF